MEYYNPIDRTSHRIAAISTFVVFAVAAVVCSYLRFDIAPKPKIEPPLEIIFEEFVEPEPPKVVQQDRSPRDVRRDKAPAHVEKATKQQTAQSSGEAEKVQTINPNALFKPVAGNSAESVATGNRLAPEGEVESHSGDGVGYNLQGSDQLDAGLQGRGLREGLPRPSAAYNEEGTVVVYVTVDNNGNVTTAEIRQQGTTTQNSTLRRLAVEAARKAKFKPSSRTAQGGTITYVFKIK
jgi:TonB family protein